MIVCGPRFIVSEANVKVKQTKYLLKMEKTTEEKGEKSRKGKSTNELD